MQTSSYLSEVTDPVYCLKEVLNSVNNRITELEARQRGLRALGNQLPWGSSEYQLNNLEQQRVHGELLGLSFAEGALEGRIGVTQIFLS